MANQQNQTSIQQHNGGLSVYATQLTTLNNSGVTAGAVVVVDTAHDRVTVEVNASGLEPGQVHPQHIHGFTDGTVAKTPTLAADTDHDGFVELAEGQKTYGPIQLDLALNPDQSASDSGSPQFPTADDNGNLHYVETFVFDPNDPKAQQVLSSITPMNEKEIVIHGESVAAGSGAGTPGEVDGTAGYKPVLPVASGEFKEVNGGEARLLARAVAHDQVSGGDSLAFLMEGPGSALTSAKGAEGMHGNYEGGDFRKVINAQATHQSMLRTDWAGLTSGPDLAALKEALAAFSQWGQNQSASTGAGVGCWMGYPEPDQVGAAAALSQIHS